MSRSPRKSFAIAAAALFAWAQTTAFCQNFAPLPKTVVTKEAAYVVGAAQMIASANADTVDISTQGRYALIVQHEASLPPGSLIGQSGTGAVAVLVYDVRAGKTRTLWQRRADGGDYGVDAHWLPRTSSVLLFTSENPQPEGEHRFVPDRLLLVNVEKGLAPQVIAQTKSMPEGIGLHRSPVKPLFVVQQGGTLRFGGPNGMVGAPLPLPSSFTVSSWNPDGTAVYLRETAKAPAGQGRPDAKPQPKENWYEWNGVRAPVLLPAEPSLFETIAPYPFNPLGLTVNRGKGLFIPAEAPPVPRPPRRPKNTPQNAAPQAAPAKPPTATAALEPAAVLRPLFLEVGEDESANNPSWSALIAPDADAGYLLSDGLNRHAVLYTSGGALYAAPIVRLTPEDYAEVQKAVAVRKAKQVGLAILQYTQDYDEEFPRQSDATDVIQPYLKDAWLTRGFVFVRPIVPLGSIPSPATLVMGYVAGPNGRAVVYVDGHAEWQAMR